jgi:hypothetical protein
MKHIGSIIPVSPQAVLFRNMIILAAFSGLIFNKLQDSTYKITLTNFESWIEKIGPRDIVLYLIIPLIWFILVSGKLKFRFWKALLVLVFFYLLWFQPSPEKIWAAVIFSFILVLFLLRFPVLQVLFSFIIWIDEKFEGNIISVVKRRDGLEGTGIQRNLLTTKLSMRDSKGYEEERIYFNKRFWEDIIRSYKWRVERENEPQ